MSASRSQTGPTRFGLIIGGMKCGTTTLFDLLSQHPEICPSREKEPDFFASDLDPRTDWSGYLRLWEWDPIRHRVALEASTAYAKYPWVRDVPEKISACPGRDFRFIYLVRDPLQRIASQVRHGVYGGWGKSLDHGLTEDLIDFSRYSMQVDRYVRIFGRGSVLVLTLDELSESPAVVLRRTCEFLGVSPGYAFSSVEEARNVGDFYGVPRPVAFLARNAAVRAVARRLLSRDARHRVRQAVAGLGRRSLPPAGRWRLNEEEEGHVRDRLADDLRRLREVYGVEASWLPTRSDGESV